MRVRSVSVTQTPRGPSVVLDGANLLWAYGHALSRRFGCKIYPASAGLLLALDYEVRWPCSLARAARLLAALCPPDAPASPCVRTQPWRAAGVRITALLPANYARGELGVLADGCGGDLKLLQRDRVRQTDRGDWVCLALEEAVAAGRVTLVRRTKGEAGRGDDDREIIRTARASNGYVCSNDQFREHFKLRGDEPRRPKARVGWGVCVRTRLHRAVLTRICARHAHPLCAQGVGDAHLFRNKKRFNEWGRERRFGCSFSVAPGLDDDLLFKMIAAQRESDAEQQASDAPQTLPLPADEAALRAMLHATPWRLRLPVYFEPFPGPAMLTAHAALLARTRAAQAAGGGQREHLLAAGNGVE